MIAKPDKTVLVFSESKVVLLTHRQLPPETIHFIQDFKSLHEVISLLNKLNVPFTSYESSLTLSL